MSGHDRAELESIVAAIVSRLAQDPPMSPSKTGELLILCDKYASAAAVAAAASGCAATVAFDQRGRSFGPSVTVVRELPDDPSAWASSFPRAVFAAPSLGSLRSLASMDCSEGVFELAFVLLGLGVCVELPPLSANPLARGFAPALAAEAGRLPGFRPSR